MPGSSTKSKMKVVVLDKEQMADKWAETQLEAWKKKNPPPPPTDPAAVAAYETKKKAVEGELKSMASGSDIHAFATNNTAYVSAGLGSDVMTHEMLHNYGDPKYEDYILKGTDNRNANNFNESMTEHFNRQLTSGVAKPGDKYYTSLDDSQYGAGAVALKQLRDERLGGPVAGEEVLRKFYFGGDTAAFDKATEATGGSTAFFDAYRSRRLDITNDEWRKTLTIPLGGPGAVGK